MVLNLSTNLVNALGNMVEWSPLYKKTSVFTCQSKKLAAMFQSQQNFYFPNGILERKSFNHSIV